MTATARLVCACLAALTVPAVAQAQIAFTGTLNGAQVAPTPTGSASVAPTWVILLNNVNGGIKFFYSGLGSNSTDVHIHSGAPGANGPIEFTFPASGSTGGGVNTFFVATPAQALLFRQGLMYIDVHTVNFPGGEVRAQLRPDGGLRGALTGPQVSTPVVTAAKGTADIEIDPTETQASLNIYYQNLVGGHTGMHLHGPALPGTDGPIILTVSASDPSNNVNFIQSVISVTPTQIAQIKAGQWYVDLHTATNPAGELRAQLKPANKPDDFDADSRAEIGVFRPSTGVWYTQNVASNLVTSDVWGLSGDIVIPADFDGDGKTDLSIFRAGVFWVRLSSTGGVMVQPWGKAGDDPRVVADYDNDGHADFTVYRPGVNPGDPNYLYILNSADQSVRIVPWGVSGQDLPVAGDFDGDRKADVATYKPSTNTYWVQRSSGGITVQPWGVFSTDWVAPQDYDGDGKTDFATVRFVDPGAGTWFILQSSTGTLAPRFFGTVGDIAVPGDYDGDGKTDAAMLRQVAGGFQWWILRTTTGTIDVRTFGLSGDAGLSFFLIR